MIKFTKNETSKLNADKNFTNVIKYEQPLETHVSLYEFQYLNHKEDGDYSRLKEKFGPVAITDEDREKKERSDRRFQMNPLIKELLEVEKEEKRYVEELVAEQLEILKVETEERAYQDGLEKGRQEGFEKSFSEYSEEGKAIIARQKEILEQLEAAKSQIFATNERFLIDLSFWIGKTLFLKDLSQDPSYVTRLAKELVESIGLKENIKVQLHPSDIEQSEKIEKELKESFEGLRNLSVEVSEHVKLGGCRVVTDFNIVDASIETQIERIYQSIVDEGNG